MCAILPLFYVLGIDFHRKKTKKLDNLAKRALNRRDLLPITKNINPFCNATVAKGICSMTIKYSEAMW